VADLERLIDETVTDALANLNGNLDALVDAAIRAHIDGIVRERLSAIIDTDELPAGDPEVAGDPAEPEPPVTRTCRACGHSLPLDRFDPPRRVCKQCRRDAARERRAQTHPGNGEMPPFLGSESNGSADSTPAVSSEP
jgi:hypothetical protein